jgi:NADH-quinone oxidoreductase subunit G
MCSAKFGYLGEAANSVGGYLAGAVPYGGATQGMNAAQMLASPRKAYILLNAEPDLDMHDPQQAMAAMRAADMVVAMSAYKHHATDYADVLLPVAPFTETSGTFVNTEGRVQSFRGAVKPLGDARPAWKVLRVLGNLLDVPGFEHDSSEAVRDEALPVSHAAGKLGNQITGVALQEIPPASPPPFVKGEQGGLQRVSDVPVYAADAVVRRAASLQMTRDAAIPRAVMHGSESQKLGVKSGDSVIVRQDGASARMVVCVDDSTPAGTVRVAAGHPFTAGLGPMFGTITVEAMSGEGA